MRITQYPWYDSWWLSAHADARGIIARSHPAVLDDFVSAIEPLKTSPEFETRVVDAVFDADELASARAEIAGLTRADLDLTDFEEARRFGRFIRRNLPPFCELQRRFVPLVSGLVGEPVEPTYNFLSLYGAPGVCEPHIDAPCAKWTLDVCVSQSQPWPIYFSQVVPWPETGLGPAPAENWADSIRNAPGLSFAPVALEPGQAAIFSGSSQWHYRDRMPNGPGRQFCELLFFHYVPAGARDVSRPQNWARLFGVPELEGLGGPMDEFI